jgi:predicted HicB family RNase H-like nuclease
MATKLTLRLDEGVIRNARRAASARGVSLSEMVSGYFQAACKGKTV